MNGRKLQKAITFDPKLGFEQNYNHWKSLDEKNTMVSSKIGFDVIRRRENLIPHPLKRYLGGWVPYIENIVVGS
jgi:hypothetical protein